MGLGLLFWALMIVSLFIAILSIKFKKTKLLLISAILILPVSLYLSASPLFEIWGLIFPLFYVGAAISLAKKVTWLASLLVVPNFILIGWLFVVVFWQ